MPDDEQFHLVVIDGDKYLAKFVKIAINVVKDAKDRESPNLLEELVRRAFPGKDRDYLATRKVRITPIANDVGYEISFV